MKTYYVTTWHGRHTKTGQDMNCAFVESISENSAICPERQANIKLQDAETEYVRMWFFGTKKKCEEMAEHWNQCYKNNGTNYYDISWEIYEAERNREKAAVDYLVELDAMH